MTITFSQLGQHGRMGNMMFQIACVIAMAKRNNTNYLFPQWQYEPYFNLHGCFSSNIKINRIYQERNFHYEPIPNFTDIDLIGYWQSWRYFEDYKDFIKEIFEFKYPTPSLSNTTSIHVRRTDYLPKSDYHTNLSNTDYYEQAIAITNSEKYLVFSDDIDFCKKKFVGPKFIFVENGTPQSDMSKMAACSSNIIANSSFSWWAAYLNKNPNKKIIAPNLWFGPKLPHNIKDLFLNEWIVI